MIDFLRHIFSPCMLIYTIPLCIVMLYWVIVALGLLDINVLECFNFDMEGLLEGSAEAAAEGAAEGAAEAVAEGVAEGTAEGLAEGAAEGAGEAGAESAAEVSAESTAGFFRAALSFLNVGKTPITIIFTFLIFQMWIMACFVYVCISPSLPAGVTGLLLVIGIFLATTTASLVLVGFTARPFRRLGVIHTIHGADHIVGKICNIKTSKVTASFGQAEIKVEDSFLLLSVRCSDETSTLAKGDDAVIVDYDREKDLYEVRSIG